MSSKQSTEIKMQKEHCNKYELHRLSAKTTHYVR